MGTIFNLETSIAQYVRDNALLDNEVWRLKSEVLAIARTHSDRSLAHTAGHTRSRQRARQEASQHGDLRPVYMTSHTPVVLGEGHDFGGFGPSATNMFDDAKGGQRDSFAASDFGMTEMGARRPPSSLAPYHSWPAPTTMVSPLSTANRPITSTSGSLGGGGIRAATAPVPKRASARGADSFGAATTTDQLATASALKHVSSAPSLPSLSKSQGLTVSFETSNSVESSRQQDQNHDDVQNQQSGARDDLVDGTGGESSAGHGSKDGGIPRGLMSGANNNSMNGLFLEGARDISGNGSRQQRQQLQKKGKLNLADSGSRSMYVGRGLGLKQVREPELISGKGSAKQVLKKIMEDFNNS